MWGSGELSCIIVFELVGFKLEETKSEVSPALDGEGSLLLLLLLLFLFWRTYYLLRSTLLSFSPNETSRLVLSQYHGHVARHGGTPKMDGFYKGKSHLEKDDDLGAAL